MGMPHGTYRCMLWHVQLNNMTREYIYFLKINIHSSCEIEDFVDTHILKLCVVLLPRVSLGVCLQ